MPGSGPYRPDYRGEPAADEQTASTTYALHRIAAKCSRCLRPAARLAPGRRHRSDRQRPATRRRDAHPAVGAAHLEALPGLRLTHDLELPGAIREREPR